MDNGRASPNGELQVAASSNSNNSGGAGGSGGAAGSQGSRSSSPYHREGSCEENFYALANVLTENLFGADPNYSQAIQQVQTCIEERREVALGIIDGRSLRNLPKKARKTSVGHLKVIVMLERLVKILESIPSEKRTIISFFESSKNQTKPGWRMFFTVKTEDHIQIAEMPSEEEFEAEMASVFGGAAAPTNRSLNGGGKKKRVTHRKKKYSSRRRR